MSPLSAWAGVPLQPEQEPGQTGHLLSLQDLVNDGPGLDEEVVQPGQPNPGEADEAYQSEEEARYNDVLDATLPHITLTSDKTATVHPPAFVSSCVVW